MGSALALSRRMIAVLVMQVPRDDTVMCHEIGNGRVASHR